MTQTTKKASQKTQTAASATELLALELADWNRAEALVDRYWGDRGTRYGHSR